MRVDCSYNHWVARQAPKGEHVGDDCAEASWIRGGYEDGVLKFRTVEEAGENGGHVVTRGGVRYCLTCRVCSSFGRSSL